MVLSLQALVPQMACTARAGRWPDGRWPEAHGLGMLHKIVVADRLTHLANPMCDQPEVIV